MGVGVIEMIRLVRGMTGENGMFGMLMDDDGPLCVTCELPWKDNKTSISCIPAGIYDVAPHNGFHFKNVWEILKVPGRAGILIHGANTINDLRGCIAVGKYFAIINGLMGVAESQLTMDFLRAQLEKKFKLEIVNAF